MNDLASAIGLYAYTSPPPGREVFKHFYEVTLAIFDQVGAKPTYIAAEGSGYTGDLTRFDGRVRAKLLKSEFGDVQTLSIVANPADSDAPAYDSFATASISHVPETGETLLSFVVAERFLGFGSSEFGAALRRLMLLYPWETGFAFVEEMRKKPEFHILGLDDGNLAPDEKKRLMRWYASSPAERVRKLRDVYPVNVLNASQVSAIGEGVSGTLEKLEGAGLWLWVTDPQTRENERVRLSQAGLLLS
jgi:hypothetical protein